MNLREAQLGAIWEAERTTFRVFAPQAREVLVNLYERGEGGKPLRSLPMERDGELFCLAVAGNLDGRYYTYTVDGVETIDPYAKSAGVNGGRGMIFDPASTDPDGWAEDSFSPRLPIVWEVHVVDFSCDPAIAALYGGTFEAFRTGKRTKNGMSCLIDYLKDLGVTYVQLLPIMDFGSVDERNRDEYNWGYDPESYFYPEGSYATNPYDGRIRVRECKRLVKRLHENGIGVILDVVYNHTSRLQSSLQICAPDYYYRMDGERPRNGAGCGNETASERTMMRKLMTDSVLYWAKEYHVDGFRFDLMGLHDVQTMNSIRAALDALPGGRNLLLYGEPWYAERPQGICPADLSHAHLLDDRIAVFNPELRDGIRGAHFGGALPGYLQGDLGRIVQIKAWLAGGLHAEEFEAPFRLKPSQQIAYAACHDDYTLFDQLRATTQGDFDFAAAHRMSAFILLSCLGIPFFQAGEEFLRTKGGNSNSYRAGTLVNRLDWTRREEYDDVVRYYAGLIALRKENEAFADPNSADFAWIPCDNEFAAAYAIGRFVYCFNNSDGEAAFEVGKTVERADLFSTELHEVREGRIVVPPHGVFLGVRLE